MSCLFISFTIISITVASMEVYSIFSAICYTMLWMHSFCVLFFFVSSQHLIVSSFLVFSSICFTLEYFMYSCPFIVESNISTWCLSLSDLLTLEYVDAVSPILFNPRISIPSWSYLIGSFFLC